MPVEHPQADLPPTINTTPSGEKDIATDTKPAIRFRPFCEDDVEPLARLIADLWFADAPADLRQTLGRIELFHHLLHHTWSLVADDGTASGVILVARRDDAPQLDLWRSRIDQLMDTLPARDSWNEAMSEGLDILDREQRVSDEILEGGEPYGDSSIELFVVSPRLRGKGVGGRLFSSAREYMVDNGARGFYLMTDDGCDFGFYDHAGMTRVAGCPSDSKVGLNVYAYAETF